MEINLHFTGKFYFETAENWTNLLQNSRAPAEAMS
jgi:hypothetical protein